VASSTGITPPAPRLITCMRLSQQPVEKKKIAARPGLLSSYLRYMLFLQSRRGCAYDECCRPVAVIDQCDWRDA
jgi:hypothetical protein